MKSFLQCLEEMREEAAHGRLGASRASAAGTLPGLPLFSICSCAVRHRGSCYWGYP